MLTTKIRLQSHLRFNPQSPKVWQYNYAEGDTLKKFFEIMFFLFLSLNIWNKKNQNRDTKIAKYNSTIAGAKRFTKSLRE